MLQVKAASKGGAKLGTDSATVMEHVARLAVMMVSRRDFNHQVGCMGLAQAA